MDLKLTTGQSLIGSHLGKYRIVEEVGMGGMSVVYRATDEVLDREVAVKLLHSHLSRRREARHRFHREARAVAKLQHPNIVEIYDFSSEESQRSYIVTEFIRGPTLREFVEGRGIHLPEIGAMIVIQVADALSHAHQLGVIHRDVKPENVMIRPDGVVKLMDFGIAHIQDAQKMTQTGSLLGSPAHMPPEAISGEETDHRGDLFSLGTVLYFATTGSLPFTGRNPAAVLRAITEGTYLDPQMRDPRIGQKLAGIIRKALAIRPQDRYQSATEMAEDLREAVAEVGLAQVTTELRRYLTAPDDYETVLIKQALEALERRGREAFEQREVARAVDCFNRILAIDDGHEGARHLLARLDRRRRLAGYALALGVALVAIGFGLFIAGIFRGGPSRYEDPEMAMVMPTTTDIIDQSLEQATHAAMDTYARQVFHALIDGKEEAFTARQREVLLAALAELGGTLEISAQSTRNLVGISPAGTNRLEGGMQSGDQDESTDRAADALEDGRGVPGEQEGGTTSGQEQPHGDGTAVDHQRDQDEQAQDDLSGHGAETRPTEGQGIEPDGGDAQVALSLPEPVRVILRPPHPPSVEMSIDGGPFVPWVSYRDGVSLPPGVHQIQYRHPENAVVPQIFDIEVPAGEEVYRVPERQRHICPWRDASLIVRSDMEANVIVDGTLVGRSGQTIPIAIDHPYGEQEFDLQVIPDERSGRRIQRSIVLRAAQTEAVEVELRPR